MHSRAPRALSLALCLAYIALLSGCAASAIARTDLYRSYYDAPLDAAVEPSIAYEKVGATHVFSLSGSEYAMGLAYGTACRDLGIEAFYETIFANAARLLADEVPEAYRSRLDVATVKWLLRDAWRLMEPHVPGYALELLRGFAEGSGIPLEDVRAVHAIPDFTETSCSALWATGSAVADGRSLQVRVLDYIMELGIQAEPAVLFLDFPSGNTVANVGWLGMLGAISGMNDAGLAVSEMGYGNPAGESFHGIPMPFLLLDVLRWCDDPVQAEGIITSRPRTNSYVYVVGTASRGGLAFVTNPYEVQVVRPGDQDAAIRQFASSLHAGHYEERMTALLAEAWGRVSIEWLRDEYLPAIAMDSNLQCVIYDLANLRFLVANAPDAERRAADQGYTEFRFSQATD